MSKLQVNQIYNKDADGAPTLPAGVVITGVSTADCFKGNITGTAGTITTLSATTVSIGGTLTYEDVTNIDSVGIVTARVGLKVLAGGANVVGASTFSDDVIFTGASYNVTWDKSADDLIFNDNAKAAFGSGSDMAIYHTGTHGYISNDTGDLILGAGNGTSIKLQPEGGEDGLTVNQNGSVDLYYDNSKKLETTAAGVSIAGTVSDSDGSIRSLPVNSQGGAYQLVAADAGKMIKITTGGVTCPNGESFVAGNMITILNESGSAQTITEGGGATLYWTADGTNGNRTLGARGVATIVMTGSSAFYISGSGLT